MKRNLALLALLTLAAPLAPALADGTTAGAKSAETERFSRAVDLVALQTNRDAAKALTEMLARSPRSPDLLIRKVDLDQEAAGLGFRIEKGGKSKGQWKTLLKETVASSTAFLAAHPLHFEVPRVLLIRAQADEELGLTAPAAKDYLTIIEKFPEHAGYGAAVLALAQQAIDRTDHAAALALLSKLEARPADPRHGLALHRMSWCHFNLGHIDSALAYSRKVFDHASRVGDDGLKDAVLLDLPVFHVEGVEKKWQGFSSADGLALFRSYAEGRELGRLVVRYAKLLRAKDLASGLNSFMDTVVADRSLGSSDEALEAETVAFEYFRNRRDSGAMLALADRMSANPAARKAGESGEKARLQLGEVMDELHAKIGAVAKAGSTAIHGASAELALLRGISGAYLKSLAADDPRAGRIHFNLAETQFAMGSFEESEAEYRLAVDSDRWKTPLSRDASVRALSARHELLKSQGLIPAELKMAAMPVSDAKSPAQALESWEKDIDAHRVKTGDALAELELALGRAWVTAGRPHHAIERLRAFVQRSPREPAAEAAASLVVDAWVVSSKWVESIEVLREFCGSTKLLNGRETFEKRLRLLLGEVEYRNDLDRLRLACQSAAPECPASLDAMIERAGVLAKQGSEAGLGAAARLLRAQLRLTNYAWDLASEDLAAAAREARDPAAKAEIQARSAELAPWMEVSADAGSVSAPKDALAKAVSALKAVPRGEKSHRARLKGLREAVRAYTQADGEERLVHLGEFVKAVEGALGELRVALPRVAPLIARENWIRWRLDAIRELESHAREALSIPLAGVRVRALRELGGAYGDLVDGLRTLKLPKGMSAEEAQGLRGELDALVAPLAAKQGELRTQADQLALESGAEVPLEGLVLETSLAKWDAAGGWDVVFGGAGVKTQASALLEAWVRAARQGRMKLEYRLWAEAESRLNLPEATLRAMRAWMFVQSGCAAEAKSEVGELQAKPVIGGAEWKVQGGSQHGDGKTREVARRGNGNADAERTLQ